MNQLALTAIRIDGGTQARAETDNDTVSEYLTAMHDGAQFPPVIVFYDGADHWLADGFHRVAAAELAGLPHIDATVRTGTRRDAVLFAAGANATHGLRRTNADKRRAVEVLLTDEEWATWSDRKIAKACGVTHPFVAKVREEKSGNGYHPDSLEDLFRAADHAEQAAAGEYAAAVREKAALLESHGEVLIKAKRAVQFNPRPGVMLSTARMGGTRRLQGIIAHVVMADPTGYSADDHEYYWVSVVESYWGDSFDAGGSETCQSKPVRKDFLDLVLQHMGIESDAGPWMEEPHAPALKCPFGNRSAT